MLSAANFFAAAEGVSDFDDGLAPGLAAAGFFAGEFGAGRAVLLVSVAGDCDHETAGAMSCAANTSANVANEFVDLGMHNSRLARAPLQQM
ncbi:MAG: hypothetical protein KF805_10550 [Phycisphaeraceae bacterium]|nr:hypothetical protein [Phycisphaeraceae bacterium]